MKTTTIKSNILRKLAGIAALLVIVLVGEKMAFAGTLTTARDYLNRLKENLTSGVQHEVFFTTAAAVSGGSGNNKVILKFPDGDDGKWCATAGSDLTVTGIANPTGATENATVLPGSLTGTCTKGSGASSYDTITVSGVNNLSSGIKYGVRIAGGSTAKLGTPANTTTGIITIYTNNGTANIDSASTEVDIVSDDQMVISASVPASIGFSISANNLSLTLSIGAVSTASHTIQVQSNGDSGYTTMVYSNGNLKSGNDDINNVTDGAVTAGSEEYGVATSDAGQDISRDTNCSGSPYTASASSTTPQSIAGAASGPVNETATICYAASINTNTIAGNYTQTITFVTVGLF
ncbi:MAG: hypothetical protein COY66_03230 [Candidatus Kerfeldbacteria bacterium CG_4_10_14_0_8_um_filter_42_10]|uniref:Uncharacterized protein n=1 Tax=Candidatus Kerfeldbacteria bacterium CG_4_10_14_0_8_um_filter_42_10 TaxID=2014248 RepID=A0A2M7RIZ9_9BACT|nr:MAG: hypothetical protein COY66_03230 [Candidatus Kerfeldbacteria bacterium CG_4_10_14_0_8_um_filter_42_10]